MIARRQRYDVFTNADEVGKSLGIFVGGKWYPIRNARPLGDVPRKSASVEEVGRATDSKPRSRD